jgi:hypothetical protein
MSLEKTVNGDYICTVKEILRELKDHPDVCFQKFIIDIESKNKKINLKKVVARHFSRDYFNKNEININQKNPLLQRIKNGTNFSGSLEYLRVQFHLQD